MTRLIGLTLDNIRSINHGRLTFNILPSGGSITGIYGQNGSGKTTIVDAISILKTLMSGQSLDSEAEESINPVRQPMRITALFHSQYDFYLTYSVEISLNHGTPTIVGEKIHTGTDRRRMGRPIIIWHPSDDRNLDLKPAYLWKTITGNADSLTHLRFANRDARRDNVSFVFSDDFTHELPHTFPLAHDIPKDFTNMLEEHPHLFDMLVELKEYAIKDIAILTTARGNLVTRRWMSLAADDVDNGYDDRLYALMQETITVTPQNAQRLHRLVDTFNIILPAMIPGMSLELADLGRDDMDDGSEGMRISLRSVRDGQRIPFRKESEGVQRLVSMLTFLIHAYNDPDSCIVIDELDAGIYEYLLGEIVREFMNAKGQLIFTAHNLRVLETMPQPAKTIILTTVNANDRFVPFGHVALTGNGRKQYLTNITRTADRILYEKPSTELIGNAFRVAGHPELQQQLESLHQIKEDTNLNALKADLL